MDDIYVYLIDMPINEMVAPSGAFGYTIYINARLNAERQREAFLHALRHIKNHDWEQDDVQIIEARAHEKGK